MSYTLLLMSIVSIIARKIKPTNETIEDKNINCVSDKLLILSTKTNVKTKNSILIYLYKRLLSFILLFIGKLCHSLGDFNTAINYYCKIINIGVGRYQSSYYYIALCYFFLEKNYSYNGGYEKAIEYYEKGFNLYPKFVSISPIYFFSFISICEEQKRWDLIIKYQDLITEDIKNTFFVSSFIKVECGSFYGSMARSYYYSDIPYALINLEKYINIDKLNRMFNYFNVAEDFRKNNNADKAFEYYNKALEVRRSDFKKMKKESYMDNYWVLLYIGYLFKYEDNIEYWQNNLNESYDKEYLYNRSYAAQDKAA
ncbi:MAG: tetratricopeptide repeat protein [bacterium]